MLPVDRLLKELEPKQVVVLVDLLFLEDGDDALEGELELLEEDLDLLHLVDRFALLKNLDGQAQLVARVLAHQVFHELKPLFQRSLGFSLAEKELSLAFLNVEALDNFSTLCDGVLRVCKELGN